MRIIAYILLGVLLCTAGIAGTQIALNKRKADRIVALEARLTAAEQSVTDMRKERAISDHLVEELGTGMAKIAEKRHTITERVTYLERSDEAIRNVLDVPLPDNGCLLDDTCGAAGLSPAGGGVAGEVRHATVAAIGYGARPGDEQQRAPGGVGKLQ